VLPQIICVPSKAPALVTGNAPLLGYAVILVEAVCEGVLVFEAVCEGVLVIDGVTDDVGVKEMEHVPVLELEMEDVPVLDNDCVATPDNAAKITNILLSKPACKRLKQRRCIVELDLCFANAHTPSSRTKLQSIYAWSARVCKFGVCCHSKLGRCIIPWPCGKTPFNLTA
jgi:hypothetical protein